MTSLLPAGGEAEPTIPFTDLSIQWRQIEEKHLYVVRSKDRDRLRDYMWRAGIETGLHYPVPLHAQRALARFQYARERLSLPLFVGMTERQVDRVCETIRRFYR